MNIKISFHNMPHSDALENHARERMAKIETLFKHSAHEQPISLELFLNANSAHTHHNVELKLNAGQYHLASHDESDDMYLATDKAIDRMVALVKKEKAKNGDKKHRVQTEKTAFAS